jgi:3-isopropylmalate/(R)-2-methylmalate dehydratase small subunit
LPSRSRQASSAARSAWVFPLITCPGIREITTRWDELKVDWEASTVTHMGSGKQLPFERLSSVERGTLEAGGFIPYLKARLAKQAKQGEASLLPA